MPKREGVSSGLLAWCCERHWGACLSMNLPPVLPMKQLDLVATRGLTITTHPLRLSRYQLHSATQPCRSARRNRALIAIVD